MPDSPRPTPRDTGDASPPAPPKPQVDANLFARAQKYHRAPLEKVLGAIYPAVHRMAAGLTGRIDVARGVERYLTKQSLRQLPNWRDFDAAERWFYHHTLLTTRRAAKHPPRTQDDLLAAGEKDPSYLAFLRALRALPFQQREAFILHHGEKFNSRLLGVAMDCSTKAADQHLAAAEETLRPLAGNAMPAMLAKLSKAYWALTPQEEFIGPSVRGYVSRMVWPRRLRRWAKILLVLLVLGALAYAAYHYRDRLPVEDLKRQVEERVGGG